MVYVRTQAWQKLAFRVLRRRENEFTSERLRRVARRWFDLDVGMYSYGCFDPDRFPPGTRIGRYCSFARSAAAFDTDHPVDRPILHPAAYHPGFGIVEDWQIEAAPLEIGDDVWIGHNATILAGARRVGRGAIIAAGAVVTEPVANYTIVAGVPAKPVRQRFNPEYIMAVEKSQWWNFNLLELRDFITDNREWWAGDRPDLRAADDPQSEAA